MSEPSPCQLLIDPPAPGPWNMAADEALLEWAAAEGQCCWRFYQWAEPTLSLGYFQDYAERRQHAASQACTVVRRLTGGGAILHDRELTYSLVLPAGNPLAAIRDRLYSEVHAALIETLAEMGVPASVWGDRPETEKGPAEPFLCFLRRTAADVVAGPADARAPIAKIAGSAQRRRRGAVLQHGSVLLGQSSCAPELPGLSEMGRTIEPSQLAEAWLPRLSRRLDLAWLPGAWSQSGRRRAAELMAQRYSTPAWTVARGREAVR